MANTIDYKTLSRALDAVPALSAWIRTDEFLPGVKFGVMFHEFRGAAEFFMALGGQADGAREWGVLHDLARAATLDPAGCTMYFPGWTLTGAPKED